MVHRVTRQRAGEKLAAMGIVSPGFSGRRRPGADNLPPGQYLVNDFPVLSAGPFRALPSEQVTVDLHCVTKWSKLRTPWRGVSLDTLLTEVETTAEFALARSYGGYTTNLPVADLLGGQAWIAFEYDGAALEAAHGGPARLLVPHLYLWKSAKWVTGIDLLTEDEPGFWETLGYHNYGDPWREQRYWGD